MHFLLRAKALVVFPGGYGTLDEFFDILTLIQTRKVDAVPLILVGEEFWRRVFDVQFLANEGAIDQEDTELFVYAETAKEIWDKIIAWYEKSGRELFPPCHALDI
jgi:predicted Rossmann-fold nucleotide-binding protein